MCVRRNLVPLPLASTAAKRLHDADFITFMKAMPEVFHRLAIDEDAHVPAHAILFVDHAETDAGISPVEIVEQRPKVFSQGLHFVRSGIGSQGTGDQDLGHQSSAVSTA